MFFHITGEAFTGNESDSTGHSLEDYHKGQGGNGGPQSRQTEFGSS